MFLRLVLYLYGFFKKKNKNKIQLKFKVGEIEKIQGKIKVCSIYEVIKEGKGKREGEKNETLDIFFLLSTFKLLQWPTSYQWRLCANGMAIIFFRSLDHVQTPSFSDLSLCRLTHMLMVLPELFKLSRLIEHIVRIGQICSKY